MQFLESCMKQISDTFQPQICIAAVKPFCSTVLVMKEHICELPFHGNIILYINCCMVVRKLCCYVLSRLLTLAFVVTTWRSRFCDICPHLYITRIL